jgi:hypothetical protein
MRKIDSICRRACHADSHGTMLLARRSGLHLLDPAPHWSPMPAIHADTCGLDRRDASRARFRDTPASAVALDMTQ